MIEGKDIRQPEYEFSEVESLADFENVLRESLSWRKNKADSEALTKFAVSSKNKNPNGIHLYTLKDNFGQLAATGRLDLWPFDSNSKIKRATLNDRRVKPDLEGKGLGTLMVQKRLIEAKEKFGCTSAVTEAVNSNPAAVRSILKNGFIVPDASSSHARSYTFYKKLGPEQNFNSQFPNAHFIEDENYFLGKSEKALSIQIDFEDHKLINSALGHGYSVINLIKGKNNQSFIKLAKLPARVLTDRDWGYKIL